jgi:hypothetical protein
VRPSRLSGLHPLLFAAFPVLYLWAENVGEIDPPDALGPMLAIVALVAFATAFPGVLVGDVRRAALVITPVAIGAFMFGHLQVSTGQPAETLFAAWIGVTLLALVGALVLPPGGLAAVDRALLAGGAALVGISLFTIVPHQVEEVEEALAPRTVLAAERTLPSETSALKRDVYWLVFDRYGSDRSFELEYGVRNPLTPWLREHGFTVLDDSHANYGATALSLATTLNMTHLEDLVGTAARGSDSFSRVHAALQSSPVVAQFRALGYRYLHLGSWWNPTRTDRAADLNLNADSGSDFTDTMAETSVLPALIEQLDIEVEPPSESVKHLKHNTFAVAALDRLAREPGPKFVFAHVLLPHPPYIYDRDGRYIDPEEAATLETADAWERQLDYTNTFLRAFLERLLALPEAERPIIILQGDEGPWTEPYAADKWEYRWENASPEELEVKFGIMNAWYVPGGVDLGLTPSQTAINTFPVLFSRYFDLEYPSLSDRVTTSFGWKRPYLLTDVTDLLPSLD